MTGRKKNGVSKGTPRTRDPGKRAELLSRVVAILDDRRAVPAPVPVSESVLDDDLERLCLELGRQQDDRIDAERALRESEERYRIVAESASDAIVTVDERNTIVFANPATEQIFGYTASELLGCDLRMLMPASEEQFELRMPEAVHRRIELRGRHKEGHEVPLEIAFGEFHRDDTHRVTAVMRDITERRQTDELRAGETRVLHMVAAGAPRAQVLEELVRLVERQSQGMLCSIFLLEESGRRLRHGAAPSLPADLVAAIDGVEFDEGAGSSGTTTARGKPVRVTDITNDPLWTHVRAEALKHGLHACWSVPIRSRQGQVLGTFTMYHREVRAPSISEQNLIDMATEIARITIERERNEEVLRERESRIRRLVDSNIIGVVFWRADGTIWEANDAFLHMLDFSREDLAAGRVHWMELTPPEHRVADKRAFSQIRRTGGCAPFEKEYLRRDGKRVPVLVGGAALEGSTEHGVAFVLDLTERKRAEERIRHMAQHDALTGLPNRVLLRDRVGQAISQAHRNRQQVALLFVDLDRFKDINDTLGHRVGDRLLRAVARRLQRCLRDGDSVARLGGDEFIICLPALSDGRDAMLVADKVLDTLRRGFLVERRALHVTGSVGISLYPENGEDIDALMRAADTAMYHAKEKGRDNFQFFVSRLNDAAQRRMLIAYRLRLGLRRGEFQLYYQPQVNLATGRVYSAEALIRWPKADVSTIPPLEFIKIAEETGLIVPLGEWVLRQACEQLHRWRNAGLSDLRITVNLSPHQLRAPGFADLTRHLLDEFDLPPAALEFEITEGLLMMHSQENVTALGRLARMGVRLAIDDFGTGYSSLSYLQRFPISVLKIDRSFVNGIGIDPNDTAIVSAIVAMAENLKLEVIAEGVETDEQIEFLKTQRCYAAQGFYYSKALPAERFHEYVGTCALNTTAT